VHKGFQGFDDAGNCLSKSVLYPETLYHKAFQGICLKYSAVAGFKGIYHSFLSGKIIFLNYPQLMHNLHKGAERYGFIAPFINPRLP